MGGVGPSLPSPSTGLGPGRAWNRGFAPESRARPFSQRTREPEASGNDDHAGEPLGTPLHEQPRVP